ncbi:MAG: hypothetical protein HY360_08565 [Verrucomicrobia bacterium]|nr:hypothetical protein [Verrucomicrobiota bacterium]
MNTASHRLAEAPQPDRFIRSDPDYSRRLTRAFFLSFLLNLLFLWMLLTVQVPRFASLKDTAKLHPPAKIPRLVLIERVPAQPKPPPKPPRERTFLETDPSQAVAETPPDAEHYSEHNTAATQTAPSPEKAIDIPKADGTNLRTKATETVRLTPPPSPPAQSPKAEPSVKPEPTAKPEPPAKPADPVKPPENQTPPPTPKPAPKTPTDLPKAGEYALLKTEPPLQKPSLREEPAAEPVKPTPQTSPRAPPSTPALPVPAMPPSSREVLAAKSKLQGGVPRIGALAFNSAQSPYASYDKKIVAKISAYWHLLLQNQYDGEKASSVEVTFRLLANGHITDLEITRKSTNANAIMAHWCTESIEKSAPFDPFPEAMRALAGEFREGSITFNY